MKSWIGPMMRAAGLLGLIGLASACSRAPTDSQLDSAGLQVGGFRGPEAVERMIQGRIYRPTKVFDLRDFLGSSSDLKALMGGYPSDSGNSTLQNATPNAVNTMLWEIALDAAMELVAWQACTDSAELEARFAVAAGRICDKKPATLAAGDLRELWMTVMRFDAPRQELDAWIEAATAAVGTAASSSGAGGTGQLVLKDLLLSIVMNPYFLLEH